MNKDNNKLQSITIEDNEEFLRQISKPVIFPDNDLLKDIKILDDYFNDSDLALAMAAVQLGIPKRLIYLKNTNLDIVNRYQEDSKTAEDKNYNERRILINPVIINKEGLTEYWEACASCLDYCGKVLRPYKIEVEYYDIFEKKHKETFEGFESTVLSHEMDHLDGILHIDIADEVIEMNPEERRIFRKTYGYKIYSKTGDYDLLKEKKKSEEN